MKHWNAVVLAGDRAKDDPVANIAQVSCKPEAYVGSKTLLEHVVSALASSQCIDNIYSIGPDASVITNKSALAALFKEHNVMQLQAERGPSLSALRGVQASAHFPTLIVTCDLPLLNAALVDRYCQNINNLDADFVIGAVDYNRIAELLPTLRKTTYRFGKRAICFANLFSVLTESGMRAIEFWQNIEGSRKKPVEVIRQVGGLSILQYKLGILSIDQAAKQLSRNTGARVAIEDITDPELAVDVDSVNDYEIMHAYLNKSK